MLIKVDENLPIRAVEILREHGYQTSSVVEQGMSGWNDNQLWQQVQSEGRFLITADKGFADLRVYPPGKHAGVLLLRPDQDGIRPIIELLERLLRNTNLTTLAKTTTVVTPRGIRVRRIV